MSFGLMAAVATVMASGVLLPWSDGEGQVAVV